ncbi:ribonuclease H-like domain-containing protein [Mycena metata]|uniref:Ribonuclease H-like domain-containing protein n=1 Tax=Mycena metata TaxID=1033252 RepID=A0AAD7NQ52_9AGAR|nr:ribonuclease H-like domain-containing protein [Mycena metata]
MGDAVQEIEGRSKEARCAAKPATTTPESRSIVSAKVTEGKKLGRADAKPATAGPKRVDASPHHGPPSDPAPVHNRPASQEDRGDSGSGVQPSPSLPRAIQTTVAKRLLEDEAVDERAAKKKKKDDKATKDAQKKQTAAAKKVTEQGAMNWPFDDLEDDPPPLPPTGRIVGRGPPKLGLLDKLVLSCHSKKDPDTRRVRCVGAGCHVSWAQPRSSGRILPHSSDCQYLSQALKSEALAASAGQSLGAKVVDAAEAKTDPFAKFKEAGTQKKNAARDAHVAKTNYLTMNLLCDGALAPELVNNDAFRNLVNHLEPNNCIVVASTFSSIYIPQEAARVTLIAISELQEQYNLDAWEAIHLHVMDLIGRERFASIGNDSTGNTKLARELGQASVPTVLIVPDPNHHLSNTIKDICKIEYFQDSIGKMRMTITYFSHSTYSATHLKALRVIFDINKGLETIGRTRFGTLYWAGYSLLRCLPAISELIELGIIDVTSTDKDKAKLAWFKQMRVFQNFTLELQQLCSILEPIARAIKCLEGLNVTVGDVWKFYVAITAVLHELFTSDSLSIADHVRDEVSAIINKRYDEMIHGPSGDLFLSGFFLDPEHVRSPILFRATGNQLAEPATPAPSSSAHPGVTDQDLRDSMSSYAKVGSFLFQVLAKEIQSGRTAPEFARYSSAAAVMAAFKSQFESYTRQYPPFSMRSEHWSKPIEYWRTLAPLPESGVLAFAAVKIFSILANSMPEERTVSRFTRLDTPDRARHDARTIVQQTQVYQHNRRLKARAAGVLPKHLPKSPSLKWRSVKKLFSEIQRPNPAVILGAPAATAETPCTSLSPGCEAGLEALLDTDSDDGNDDATLPKNSSTTLHTLRDGVSITLPFFRDLLADVPVVGANEIRSLADWAGEVSLGVSRQGRAAGKKTWNGEAEKIAF